MEEWFRNVYQVGLDNNGRRANRIHNETGRDEELTGSLSHSTPQTRNTSEYERRSRGSSLQSVEVDSISPQSLEINDSRGRRRITMPSWTIGEGYAGSFYSGMSISSDSSETQQESYIKGNVEVSKERRIADIVGNRTSYPTIQGHPLVVGKSLAGIEIELEGVESPSNSLRYWEAKSDGSLRDNGVEYVCSSPWGGLDLYNAIMEVDSELYSRSPKETWRCSTHVHVDVRDLTVKQLKRMILAYIFYERVLFRCSGFHRYKNNFCVAVGYAQEMVNILSSNWEKDGSEFLNGVTSQWDKYTALNLLPMMSFGSVEFRISEAKWRKGKLVRLANRFLSLKEIAQKFEGTDEEFINFLLTQKVDDVIQKSLPKDFPIEGEDIEFGAKIAFDVISMFKIRKNSREFLTVDLEDGSRVLNLTDPISKSSIWAAAAEHVKTHLRRRHDLHFKDDVFPQIYTLDFLCNIRSLMTDSQWGDDWFLPRGMRESEFREYYRNYLDR